jgi:ParB family transcriptional regulator, chromosome partitioning protein
VRLGAVKPAITTSCRFAVLIFSQSAVRLPDVYALSARFANAHSVRQRLDHANVLARTVGLDMAAVGWKPTADNYFGRVTKPRILEAVPQAKGEPSVQLIDHLKKGDMAREAERLLDGTGWLPEPLRLVEFGAVEPDAGGEAGALPEFLADPEDEAVADAEEDRPHIIAAE